MHRTRWRRRDRHPRTETRTAQGQEVRFRGTTERVPYRLFSKRSEGILSFPKRRIPLPARRPSLPKR